LGIRKGIKYMIRKGGRAQTKKAERIMRKRKGELTKLMMVRKLIKRGVRKMAKEDKEIPRIQERAGNAHHQLAVEVETARLIHMIVIIVVQVQMKLKIQNEGGCAQAGAVHHHRLLGPERDKFRGLVLVPVHHMPDILIAGIPLILLTRAGASSHGLDHLFEGGGEAEC